MKKKELLALGFQKNTDNDDPNFKYYTLDLSGGLCLISCGNTERDKKDYTVTLYEAPGIEFKTLKRLKQFIKIVTKNIK